MSKYASVIAEAKKQENQQTSNTEDKEVEAAVNLTVKVSKKLRRHWVSEAKRQDTTLTAAIIEALTHRFGSPDQ